MCWLSPGFFFFFSLLSPLLPLKMIAFQASCKGGHPRALLGVSPGFIWGGFCLEGGRASVGRELRAQERNATLTPEPCASTDVVRLHAIGVSWTLADGGAAVQHRRQPDAWGDLGCCGPNACVRGELCGWGHQGQATFSTGHWPCRQPVGGCPGPEPE